MALRKVIPIVAAGAVAGILGVGGASIALAQEEPSTTTPSTGEDQQPTSPTPDDRQPNDGKNCPERDGAQGDGSSTDGSRVLTAN